MPNIKDALKELDEIYNFADDSRGLEILGELTTKIEKLERESEAGKKLADMVGSIEDYPRFTPSYEPRETEIYESGYSQATSTLLRNRDMSISAYNEAIKE